MSDKKTEEQELEEALEAPPVAPAPVRKKTPAKKKAKKKAGPAEPHTEPEQKREPIVTETITDAATEKREADAARRKKAIAEAPRPPDPSEADAAEQDRKAKLRAKMAEIQGEIDELNGSTDAKKEELRAVSAELYPHLERSDHHTVAVKGYVARQKELRATRASNPETIKRMIAQASKAPIDAAMSRNKGRGQSRPNRQPAGVSPAQDTAKE